MNPFCYYYKIEFNKGTSTLFWYSIQTIFFLLNEDLYKIRSTLLSISLLLYIQAY